MRHDESVYWMELLVEAGITKTKLLESLMNEGNEIRTISVASIITARKHKALPIGVSIRDPRSKIRKREYCHAQETQNQDSSTTGH